MAYDESIRSITLDADSSVAVYTGVPGLPGSANPNGGNQYKVVKVTGAHTCGLVSGVGDAAIGVLQNKPQVTGAAATVAIRGVTRVLGAKAITAGTKCYLAADGRVTDVATGATYVGVAVSTTANANEILSLALQL